jgi:hypothetical protein
MPLCKKYCMRISVAYAYTEKETIFKIFCIVSDRYKPTNEPAKIQKSYFNTK